MRTIKLLLCLLVPAMSFAQLAPQDEHYQMIMAKDSLLFELSFNQCQNDVLQDLISEDFEFYHDQGGITKGKQAFIQSIDKNICNFPGRKSRRELVAGSTKIYPLYQNDGTLYGLLQQGEHKFYFSMNGGPEQKGAIALFSHLWIKEGENWMLQRSYSYDHKPQQ